MRLQPTICLEIFSLSFVSENKGPPRPIRGCSNKTHPKTKEYLEWHRENNPDGYSRTQAFKLFNNHVKVEELDKLIAKLEEMNLIYNKPNAEESSLILYYAN